MLTESFGPRPIDYLPEYLALLYDIPLAYYLFVLIIILLLLLIVRGIDED